jgi:hypothetical protein
LVSIISLLLFGFVVFSVRKWEYLELLVGLGSHSQCMDDGGRLYAYMSLFPIALAILGYDCLIVREVVGSFVHILTVFHGT